MFPFFPDVHGAPFNPAQSASRMTRWCVDMSSRSDEFSSMQRLTELVGEFPKIDERYATQPYRHGYLLAQDFSRPVELPGGRSASGMMMNLLGHIDHATARAESWWSGKTTTIQEPVFIPRPGSTAEGDGYLAAIANRLDENRSDLLLFDAGHLTDGPIAVVKLELRLRGGLHGNWSPIASLPPEPSTARAG